LSEAEKWKYLKTIESCLLKGNSYTSIRRDVLLHRVDVLKGLTPAVDAYNLASAMIYGRDLLFDRAVLTAHRIHPNQFMTNLAISRSLTFSAYARKMAERELGFFRDQPLVLDMARGTRYGTFIRSVLARSKLSFYLYRSALSSTATPDLLPNAGDYLALLRFAPDCREAKCILRVYAFMAVCALPRPVRRLAVFYDFLGRNRV